MSKDFGARRRRLTPGQTLVLAAAAVAAVAIPGWLVGERFLKDRAESIARARSWAIDGPPCPQLTRAQFEARRLKTPKGVDYAGVLFFRQFGHMTCTPLRDQGGAGLRADAACQFTSPNALKVVTRQGEWYFAPGPGQPATVFTPRGQAHCVLNARFRLS